MKGVRLDHATINTVDLQGSIDFFAHFLGLKSGWRPDFGFDGAWLYATDGDYPIVHLIGKPAPRQASMFNHIAFRGDGLSDYIDKVRQAGGWFEAKPVAGTPYTQIHHFDPNGVRIEVLFEEPLGAERIASSPEIPHPSDGVPA